MPVEVEAVLVNQEELVVLVVLVEVVLALQVLQIQEHLELTLLVVEEEVLPE
jgi:hypothetical protein